MIAALEEDIINAFVVRRKRERHIDFLRSPRRRREFLDQLYHFNDFDPACIVPLALSHASARTRSGINL